jgi:hypothetical protein
MSIHNHIVPKKGKFKVKLAEGKSDKPTHVVYGLWIAVAVIMILPNKKKERKLEHNDVMKSYDVLMRTLGLL